METKKYPVLVVENNTDRRRALRESLLKVPEIELYSAITLGRMFDLLRERGYDAMVFDLAMAEMHKRIGYNSLIGVRKDKPGMLILGFSYRQSWLNMFNDYHPSVDVVVENGDIATLTKTLRGLLAG